jgi:hypothetical protein
MDNGKVFFSKNGTFQGSSVPASGTNPAASGLSGTWAIALQAGGSTSHTLHLNAGQRSFSYAAPSGYKSLNTASLPEPTIADGSQYFNTKLYTGDGSNPRSITGVGHSSDFVWIKARNAAAGHVLQDVVRGPGNNVLASHTTGAEGSETYGQINSFDSDGFTVTNGASGDQNINQNNRTYAAWSWDAGDSNTTIAAGDLNSSAYNQSRTWSDDWTGNFGGYDPADGFNGSETGKITVAYPSGSSGITLTVSPAISGSVIRVLYTRSNTSTPASINGTETLPSTGSGSNYQWHTLTATSISSVTLTHDGIGSSYIAAIEVDGKILVNSGVTPPNVPSIASTVRANPSAGFSIVSYTGTGSVGTIGHSLNAKPELIIVKNRTNASDWYVFGDSIDSTYDERLTLNSTGAKTSSTSAMNATAPTSSVFTVGGNAGTNGSSTNIIAYCFTPVEGYSSVGSYTGNGSSSDGPFVFTGHSVAWIMIKRSDAVDNWVIYDVARDTYNIGGRRLYPDLSGGETQNTSHYVDILSNGFKVRSTGGMLNASGGNYIYMSFASNPFASNGGLAR